MYRTPWSGGRWEPDESMRCSTCVAPMLSLRNPVTFSGQEVEIFGCGVCGFQTSSRCPIFAPRMALFFDGVFYPKGALVASGVNNGEHFRRVQLSRYIAVEVTAEKAFSSGSEVPANVHRWNVYRGRARRKELFLGRAREETDRIIVVSL